MVGKGHAVAAQRVDGGCAGVRLRERHTIRPPLIDYHEQNIATRCWLTVHASPPSFRNIFVRLNDARSLGTIPSPQARVKQRTQLYSRRASKRSPSKAVGTPSSATMQASISFHPLRIRAPRQRSTGVVRLAEQPKDRALRDAWFDAPEPGEQKRLTEKIQAQAFEDVPYTSAR